MNYKEALHKKATIATSLLRLQRQLFPKVPIIGPGLNKNGLPAAYKINRNILKDWTKSKYGLFSPLLFKRRMGATVDPLSITLLSKMYSKDFISLMDINDWLTYANKSRWKQSILSKPVKSKTPFAAFRYNADNPDAGSMFPHSGILLLGRYRFDPTTISHLLGHRLDFLYLNSILNKYPNLFFSVNSPTRRDSLLKRLIRFTDLQRAWLIGLHIHRIGKGRFYYKPFLDTLAQSNLNTYRLNTIRYILKNPEKAARIVNYLKKRNYNVADLTSNSIDVLHDMMKTPKPSDMRLNLRQFGVPNLSLIPENLRRPTLFTNNINMATSYSPL